MSEALTILFALIVVHAVCDYPLQGDFLARAKNFAAPIAGVPWWQAMGAHSLIHGGGVMLVTGSAVLGMVEAVAHFSIDAAKCGGKIKFNTDQALHVACKVVWTTVAAYGWIQ